MNDSESLGIVKDQRKLIKLLHPGVPVLLVATKVGTDSTDKEQNQILSSDSSTADSSIFEATDITDTESCTQTFFKAFSMAAIPKLYTKSKQ